MLKQLEEINFEKAGNWTIINGNLDYKLDKFSNEKSVLYAFVINDNVKYVGKTNNYLYKRLYGYKKPNETQTTNFRINEKIRNLLSKNYKIDIYVFKNVKGFQFKSLDINLSAGLEDNIITHFNPDWNYIGKNKNNQKIKTMIENKNERTISEKAELFFENKKYIIKKYSDKTILIFDENNIRQEIKVLPFLKDVINKKRLDIIFYHLNHQKNTRTLGAEVIKRLNLKN